ncbi:MAG: isoamylase early set domain-containing protein [Candidatus Latescibacterota bacterium]|nr:MAG: isoamylase early set domain-containing protein [Candidatus Latescibacterota bacterium]
MSKSAISIGILVIALGAFLSQIGCASGGRGGVRGGPEIVEGGVIFRYYDPDASRVYVVGDFNNWTPRADPLVDTNGDGEWTLFYNLPPGVYEYKFLVDGTEWIADPKNPENVPDGFEGRNSVLRIPGG